MAQKKKKELEYKPQTNPTIRYQRTTTTKTFYVSQNDNSDVPHKP